MFEDVSIIFDDTYFQKSREYFEGEMMGCDNKGELYKGIVCFMRVGLKESIPYVTKSLPETNIDANWLKTELLDSLKILSNCGFPVRAIFCDNHPMNVSSFKKLLEQVNQNPNGLYMLHKSRKYSLRLNFLDLKIQSMFVEEKLHGKPFMMPLKETETYMPI